MKRSAAVVFGGVLMCGFANRALATDFTVVPFEFDPRSTHLVAAKWKAGLGCPSNGVVPAASTNNSNPPPFSDTGCPTTDGRDDRDDGLLLSKAGPTSINASAGATITGVKNIRLSELGYDLRKPESLFDPRGSHCGPRSPRFSVVTKDGVTHAVGCNAGVSQTSNGFWVRLRFALASADPPISGTSQVKSISIVMDEGPDVGPDNFGLSVLDNIDINGTLIGRGPAQQDDSDRDEGHGKDANNRNMDFKSSASRPESSSLSYEDPVQGVAIQMIGAARAIAYTGACVSFVGDALLNDDPDNVLTFSACDLSPLSTPLVPQIGSYSMTVTGASGIVYQRTGTLTSGLINIH